MGHEDCQLVFPGVADGIDHIQGLVNIGAQSALAAQPVQTEFCASLLVIAGGRDLGQLRQKGQGLIGMALDRRKDLVG